MDLMQLNYFMVVAKYESISLAAQELYISQPALSQSIARLEDSLGQKLFDRKKGRLKLNEAGQILLQHTQRVFGQLKSAETELLHYLDEKNGHLKVSSSVVEIFVSLIIKYLENHENLRISLNLTPCADAVEDLLNGTVEFALVSEYIDDARLTKIPLYEEEVFLVTGGSHPFAARAMERIPLQEVVQEPVGCNPYDGNEEFVNRLFSNYGVRPQIRVSTNESQVLVAMTVKGECIGFVPARVAMKHLTQHIPTQIPIRMEPPVYRTIYMMIKKDHIFSASSQEFFDFAINFCKEDDKKCKDFLQNYYQD